MPTGKLYRNGLTMGAGGNPKPVGGPRGKVVGWTTAAVRRHTRWLYSVDVHDLTGYGWSPTLTLRDCPPTPQAWTSLRKAYVDALRRSGLIVRGHWVVEWQRRKVPHLHMAVYLSENVTRDEAWRLMVDTWVRLGAKYGAGPKGQHLGHIDGALGWLEYLSKHAARGVAHYQRAGKPEGWDTTGRLWGYFGEWPNVEPAEVTLTRSEFWRFRRLVRSWRIADARAAFLEGKGSTRRIRSARSMLACNDRSLSEVRGVSEWIPEEIGMDLLALIAGDVVAGGGRRKPAPPATAPPPQSEWVTGTRF